MPKVRSVEQEARRLAWEVLCRYIRDDAYPDLLIASQFKNYPALSRADRALASELVFGTIRWQASLDRALGRVCHRPLKRIHPKLLTLLRLGAYQLLYLGGIPARAAVNEAVEMSKALRLAHGPALVNGVLREVHRRGRQLLSVEAGSSPPERLSQETSHPQWMVERWIEQWGFEEAAGLCRANNHPPSLTLRTNTLKMHREELAEILQAEGIVSEKTTYGPEGLHVLHLPAALDALKSFSEGGFSVQDEASQLIGHWLNPSPGDHILDACAAPGGKSTHLAQLMRNQGQILAADIHEGRLKLLDRECIRLGITCVDIFKADLTNPTAIPCDASFDRILLDGPCTGLGVIRRHPDAKWRRSPEDVDRLARLQLALLKALAPKLRPGGILLYGVCTHTREETERVLEAFLSQDRSVRLLLSSEGLPPAASALLDEDGIFRSFPHRHQMDGFTAFRIQRINPPR